MMDVQVLPGMTVPEKTDVLLALRGDWADLRVELPESCEQLGVTERQGYRVYRLRFGKLGVDELAAVVDVDDLVQRDVAHGDIHRDLGTAAAEGIGVILDLICRLGGDMLAV